MSLSHCLCLTNRFPGTIYEVLGIPKVTSFSRMRISVAVNGSSSSMESVLKVGFYFEKMGF